RHTIFSRDWSSDVCSSDLGGLQLQVAQQVQRVQLQVQVLLARGPHGLERRQRLRLRVVELLEPHQQLRLQPVAPRRAEVVAGRPIGRSSCRVSYYSTIRSR